MPGRRDPGDGTSPPDPRGKRAAILEAARTLFLETGYGSTNVDAIAQRAAVSKATVYAHFPGKAELFSEVIRSQVESSFALVGVDLEGSAEERLTLMAERFLDLVLSPAAVSIHRCMIAEGAQFPELTELFVAAGPDQVRGAFRTQLARIDAQGLLSIPDPELASELFLGMLKGQALTRSCLELPPEYTGDGRTRRVTEAVRLMCCGYAAGG